MGGMLNKLKRAARKTAVNPGSRKTLRNRLILVLAAFFIAAAGLRYIYVFYTTSPYFTIKKVIIIGGAGKASVDYGAITKMLTGRNIFMVNLKAISSYIVSNYGELRSLEMKKVFPDSICATVVLRRPAAMLLYGERYYPADADCVVLSAVGSYVDKRLPLISGINANLPKMIGKRINSQCLRQALILFKFIAESGILKEHSLSEINAGNMNGMSFWLDGGIEVRIGHEDYSARLRNLKEILKDPKIWPSDIGYIDLRFGEPVIGPKWKR